jgi:tRNA A37 methylthiotransferase MiaB
MSCMALISKLDAGEVTRLMIADADVVIVNTCAFIEDAKKESIEVSKPWSAPLPFFFLMEVDTLAVDPGDS